MTTDSLTAEREHLANLLEAVQRCTHFLYSSSTKVNWPLDGGVLKQRQKDEVLFKALAAFNERFAKLQDTLGAAMRHCALLMSEANSPFLKVLALFEKLAVIESIDGWQMCGTARNLAAHDYETDYALIAEHFNELHTLQPVLVGVGSRLLARCAQSLGTAPTTTNFENGLRRALAPPSTPKRHANFNFGHNLRNESRAHHRRERARRCLPFRAASLQGV